MEEAKLFKPAADSQVNSSSAIPMPENVAQKKLYEMTSAEIIEACKKNDVRAS